MISRYEAVLNGQPLSAISADILILDISYPPASIDFSTYRGAKRHGNRVYRQYVDHLDVIITFAIRAYNTQKRQTICNAVQQWAKNGGILQTNDHSGQRLRCVLTTPPTIQSVLKWTDPISMTFTAYALPFWEEVFPSSLTLTGTSGSGTLFVHGSADGAFFEVDVTPANTLTTLNLVANGRTLSLTGISVAAGTVVKVAYDDDMIMSIKAGNTSLLNKRSGADDLPIKSGERNSLSFSANTSCTVSFKGRGIWA